MRKFKVLGFLLLSVLVLSCTSCGKVSESKFLEIVNEPMENYTCEIDMTIRMEIQGQNISVPMDLHMEVSETEVYTTTEVQGSKVEVYYEIHGDYAEVWMNDGYGWEKQSDMPMEKVGTQALLPTEEIEKGDFKYKKGVWEGDVDKIYDKLAKAIEANLGALQSMGTFGDIDLELEVYNIIIEKGEISEVEMKLSYQMYVAGQYVDAVAKYQIEFSEIGSTKVTRPSSDE